MSIIVRKARVDEAAKLVNIHNRSVRQLCSADYDKEQIEAWAGRRTVEDYELRIKRVPSFVAESDGVVAGYATYSPKTSELLSVFIDPDYTRQGIASLLVEELLKDARSQGLTSLWLDSSLTAVPFYESVGFVGSEELTHDFSGVLILE